MSGDIKESFYEKVGRAFDQFPNYHTKILLLFCRSGVLILSLLYHIKILFGNFTAKVG
jgi:hypothetical protein